jgi:hypothetical protein
MSFGTRCPQPGRPTVEKLITSVHELARFVDRPVEEENSRTSFSDSVAGGLGRL